MFKNLNSPGLDTSCSNMAFHCLFFIVRDLFSIKVYFLHKEKNKQTKKKKVKEKETKNKTIKNTH